MLFVAVTGHCV